ncbi:MAG TPA: molybdate ABC transporter permease subunit [Candidatus Binatia bacterium]|nr:molybdate ABC transporter permease subunit [Candidatus Binatia bacterium]
MSGVVFPLWLSLRVATLATLAILPVGVFLAHVQARYRYPGRGVVGTLLVLPLVLPPTVVGYYLVALLGPDGPIGAPLQGLTGASIMFTFWACVVAAAVVAFPLLVRAAQGAFETIDPSYEEIAYTLGSSRLDALVRVRLPLAARGILAGAILAFSRALGEFGATMMLAGNIPGRTNTMPLEVFSAYVAGDGSRARMLVLVLTVVSAIVLVASDRLGRRPHDA